jgi:hypothetical protein
MYVDGDMIYAGLYNGYIWCWNIKPVRNLLEISIKFQGVLNAVHYQLSLANSSNSDHGAGNLGTVNAIMGFPGKLYASVNSENSLQEWSIKLVKE